MLVSRKWGNEVPYIIPSRVRHSPDSEPAASGAGLVSNSELRYEGILYTINTQESGNPVGLHFRFSRASCQ